MLKHQVIMKIRKFKILLIFMMLFSSYEIVAMENCGNVFDLKIGPWDYTDPATRQRHLGTVERRHFTDRVKNLIRGETGNEIMPDLVYTLNKFPNHYEALMSLIKYDQRLKGVLPKSNRYKFTQSVSCYFNRALQFTPSDSKLLQLYGIYFHKNKKYQEAVAQYQYARKFASSPELDYNLGLAYFELGDMENAKKFAEQAYLGKFPLVGLKNMLAKKGIALEFPSQ